METSTSDEVLALRTPAKLNLNLQVGSLREDGYHDLTTVYQAISLYDELRIYRQTQHSVATSRPQFTILVSGIDSDVISVDSSNLVIRAAELLAQRFQIRTSLHFVLHKSIPTEAGLGGGSSDAAATLVSYNALWGLGLGQEDLMMIGAEIGEDVPFAILGMMAVGLGHKQPLVCIPNCRLESWNWVLGVLNSGLSTKQVFQRFDEIRGHAL
jgi:4-diphosphocytidyl-2-C-methyl-D-erythritol kinase